jgi:hypothetical protein
MENLCGSEVAFLETLEMTHAQKTAQKKLSNAIMNLAVSFKRILKKFENH